MNSDDNERERDQVKAELVKLLEATANGDISASVAISLRRIADRLDAAPSAMPPRVIQR